jgi:hypothetical protein
VKSVNPQSRFNHANAGETRRYRRNRATDAQAGLAQSHAQTRRQGSDAVVARMATFILERTAEGGGCTEGDLKRAGFQSEDLKHMPAAVRVAAKAAPGLQGGG